jgi:hypothetical protein
MADRVAKIQQQKNVQFDEFPQHGERNRGRGESSTRENVKFSRNERVIDMATASKGPICANVSHPCYMKKKQEERLRKRKNHRHRHDHHHWMPEGKKFLNGSSILSAKYKKKCKILF